MTLWHMVAIQHVVQGNVSQKISCFSNTSTDFAGFNKHNGFNKHPVQCGVAKFLN